MNKSGKHCGKRRNCKSAAEAESVYMRERVKEIYHVLPSKIKNIVPFFIENQLKVIKPNHISGSNQTLLMIFQQSTAEALMR